MTKVDSPHTADIVERFKYILDPGFPSGGAVSVPTDDLRVLLTRTAEAAAEIKALRSRLSPTPDTGLIEALRLFVGSAYPVATEINQRGYNWCEAYLDSARTDALKALANAAPAQVESGVLTEALEQIADLSGTGYDSDRAWALAMQLRAQVALRGWLASRPNQATKGDGL